jgi:hypothetical protein
VSAPTKTFLFFGGIFFYSFFTESLLDISVKFFERFKVVFVPKIIVCKLTIMSTMHTAYIGPFMIDPAAVVFCQIPTRIKDFKEPFALFIEDRRFFMR